HADTARPRRRARAVLDPGEETHHDIGESAVSPGRLASNPFLPIEGHPMAAFELYKDRQGQFRWRLKASNGKILADSGEGYARRIDGEQGIELVKSEAAAAEVKDLTAADVAEKSCPASPVRSCFRIAAGVPFVVRPPGTALRPPRFADALEKTGA